MSNNKYGKFKDEQALYEAYLKLEAEFTKKCQQLKEYEQNASDNKVAEDNTTTLPLYQREDWQDKIAEFISIYPLARRYAGKIGKILLDEPSLATNEEGLSLALLKILAQEYKTPEDMVQDDDFLDGFVYTNERIRQKIIADYIESLADMNSPTIMARGGEVFVTPAKKPRTIREASAMAYKMLK